MGLFVGRRSDGHGLVVSRQWNTDDYAGSGSIIPYRAKNFITPLIWVGTVVAVGFAVSKILKL